MTQVRIEGSVAPGFESVKRLYERNMYTLAERDTQLCVYHHGEKVVDLWGSASGNADFSADSLVNVFSSGKSLEAIAMASLVDKGLLRYEAKIAEYWPEFAANGKAELTVADLMRHEAGLAAFKTSIPPEDLLTENLKLNRVGAVIEAHPPAFRRVGSRREYHAVTRGWIANEVFRRVDPEGRTIGEFLRQDISGPLGVDVIIGLRQDELERVTRVTPISMGFQFWQSLTPRLLGRRMEHNIFEIGGRILRILPGIRNGTTAGAAPAFVGMNRVSFFNEPAVAMGETPSANTNASARGLAKVAAVMAAGGEWAGKRYLGEAAWKAMHDHPIAADMGFTRTTFTQGGVAHFADTTPASSDLDRAINTGREGFYGWMGLGGSLFQWHPQHRIGFGYVPTSLHVLDLVNERGKAYQAEVLRCAGAVGGSR